jgi:hypothetical protein
MCRCWFEPEEELVEERALPAVDSVSSRDPDVRVSQAERDEVAAVLARHYADGRLSLDEYEERVAAALAARTGHDFEPLLADLPTQRRPDVRPRRGRTAQRSPVPAWSPVRVVAVAAVIALAVTSGLWALWLLWPALVLTGSCGRSYGRSVAYRSHHRPAVTQRV